MSTDLLFWLVVFAGSLAVLIKASDIFTDAAEAIGLRMGISHFIIGVTIVALGTSLPELVSSIVAVLQGSSEIVPGNVVGSNATNILLVLGAAGVINRSIEIDYGNLHVDLMFLSAATLLMVATCWDGQFTAYESILCFIAIAGHLYYTLTSERPEKDEDVGELDDVKGDGRSMPRLIGAVVASAFFIFLGAQYTVEAVIKVADLVNIGREIIAVSAVALGTSLPELMVTINAAKKGKAELAVGNVLGSNIFNSLYVMSIPALFGTLVVPAALLNFGIPVMVLATFAFVLINYDHKVTRTEGYILLAGYLLFVGRLIFF